MDDFPKSSSDNSTDLPSSNNGNTASNPLSFEDFLYLDEFDFRPEESYPAAPLNGPPVPRASYTDPIDQELLDRRILPKMEEYHQDVYSDESTGFHADPTTFSLSPGLDLNYGNEYNGEPGGSRIDPAAISASSGGVQSRSQLALTIDPTILGAEANQQGIYRNAILNSFTSPAIPLRIIDEVQFPFQRKLQLALEVELEREKHRDLADGLRNAVDISAPASSPAERQFAPLKKPGNKRPDNIKNFNAAEFYRPLRSRPASWGSINPETGEQLFQYTENGELNPLHTFTVQQIIEYIGQHPLNYRPDPKKPGKMVRDSKNSGLKLWVQCVPADSGRRYPDKLSDKCRFANCPDPHRTIRKGDFRIAFDEQPRGGRETDPFHNAGYVHLYCMEKFLDFPLLCKSYNALPDTREFREGKNKMAITRDHQSMAGIVKEFMELSQPWSKFRHGQRPEEYYCHTLCSALTDEHLSTQPGRVQSTRDERGGNSIDVHKNNLDKWLSNSKIQKENKKRRLLAGPKAKSQKRKNVEQENVLDENILASPRSKRRRMESVATASIPKNRKYQSRSPSPAVKQRRNASAVSVPSPKTRTWSTGSITTRSMTRRDSSCSNLSSTPSPKKRRREEDNEPFLGLKRRRSPRNSSKSPRTPENVSWPYKFHRGGRPTWE